MSTTRIVSYNVLSTSLASPDYYVNNKPEWLDSGYRLKKLKDKLDYETKQDAIICLQEVSNYCAGVLHTYFAKKGYYLVTAQYGHKWNGYMGVGIAVPLGRYSLEDLDITRIADTKRTARRPPDSWLVRGLKTWILEPFQKLLLATGLWKKPLDVFADALKRMNQMVSVRLSERGGNGTVLSHDNSDISSTFVVSTYHMPCMFDYPAVMMIHCALAAQHIQRWARGDAYVLAGDFNVKPVDPMYRLLTMGDVDPQDPARPLAKDGDEWSVRVQPLQSAYAVCEGHEPPYTNYAQTQESPAFRDTLDYIFLSPHWGVRSVLPLPASPPDGPQPTEHEPSDHLLIAADIFRK